MASGRTIAAEGRVRRAARTDATHAAIVAALRKVGCQVRDTSRVGQGFPDLVVRVPFYPPGHFPEYEGGAWPKVLLMEVKSARGRITDEQRVFLDHWPETVIVHSVDEALAAVGIRSQP